MARPDGRAADELRPVRIATGAQQSAEGSVMVETGNTRVLCAVTVEDRVPPFLRGTDKGWITAEYAMLPRATVTRSPRETRRGGRTHEIQRLIGRSLRAVVDLAGMGERTLVVDCDVIQADGGTRTAAITGAYVAVYQAFAQMVRHNEIPSVPIRSALAATSVGIVNGESVLDLCYEEDFSAHVDVNVVMTEESEFVEIQGTAEGQTFSKMTLDGLLALAETGIKELFKAQRAVIKGL